MVGIHIAGVSNDTVVMSKRDAITTSLAETISYSFESSNCSTRHLFGPDSSQSYSVSSNAVSMTSTTITLGSGVSLAADGMLIFDIN